MNIKSFLNKYLIIWVTFLLLALIFYYEETGYSFSAFAIIVVVFIYALWKFLKTIFIKKIEYKYVIAICLMGIYFLPYIVFGINTIGSKRWLYELEFRRSDFESDIALNKNKQKFTWPLSNGSEYAFFMYDKRSNLILLKAKEDDPCGEMYRKIKDDFYLGYIHCP